MNSYMKLRPDLYGSSARYRAACLLSVALASCGVGVDALNPPPFGTNEVLASECRRPAPGWLWCDDYDTNRLGSYFEYDSAGGRFTRVSGVGAEG